MDRLVVSDDEGALALGVALLDDFPVPREAQAIAARGAQAMVDGEQRLDVPGDLDAGGDEDDEVVTDALEVCDEMRGEHDAHAVLDGNGHESPQELAPSQRVEARPGFGDSDKPTGAPYDARFFARAAIDLLDALALDRVHLIGNSLGGRVALEIALRDPGRVGRLALLAPSLAWRRQRPWLPLLRLTRPELGLVQLAPRPAVEAIVHRLIPGADEGWTAAGVDEFLRAYLTPAGRAAFYAAARHIYLEEPHGEQGFWPRLRTLQADALFVWGRRDRLVPIAFARHVEDALPRARHLELDCGHVPQIERPKQTHAALAAFLWRGNIGEA